MNTQTPFMARGRIAWALDMTQGDIRIIPPYVGGGFGGKSCDDNNALVASVLSRVAGRPVKLINTREEEFLAGSRPRVPMKIAVKIGFKQQRARPGEVHPPRRRQRRVLRQGAGCLQRRVAAPRHRLPVPEREGRVVPGLHEQHPDRRVPGLRQPVRRVGDRAGLGPGRRRARHRPGRARAAQRGRAGLRVAPREPRHQLRAQAEHHQGRRADGLEREARGARSRCAVSAWAPPCT